MKTKKSKILSILLLVATISMVSAISYGSVIDLPKTSQTKCYDAMGNEIACEGSGQDGELQEGIDWPTPRFSDNGDGTMTDNLTGLKWLKDASCSKTVDYNPDNTPTGEMTWQHALDFIKEINAGSYSACATGHNDWRLPNANELESLVSFAYKEVICGAGPCSNNSVWLNNQGFLNVQVAGYWSATTFHHLSNNFAWHTVMSGGIRDIANKTDPTAFPWPVRGETSPPATVPQTGQQESFDANTPQRDDGSLKKGVPWPTPRFIDNDDGTVTDVLTGLMWLKDANCAETIGHDPDGQGNGKMNWQNALDLVKGINNGTYSNCSAGYNDWHLPNVNELGSLVDFWQASPPLPPANPFTNVPIGYEETYWSSTTYTVINTSAWMMDMFGGRLWVYDKASYFHVWPVRQVTPYTGPVDLPKTGQIACYDAGGNQVDCAGTGQDGDVRAGVSWPVPRFKDNADGTVTDNLTGLTWLKDAECLGTNNWNGALDAVANFNINPTDCDGYDENNPPYTDWRIPNINELASLINAEQGRPDLWLIENGFLDVKNIYWSSTTVEPTPANAKMVNMNDGTVGANAKNNNRYIWPVRGTSKQSARLWRTGQNVRYHTGDDGTLEFGARWPDPRFTVIYCNTNGPCAGQDSDCDDNADNDLVKDNLTDIVWTRDANISGLLSWIDALGYAKTLNLCGYKDWHLPNRKELLSIVDDSQKDPALPSGHPFNNVQIGDYWSSTTYAQTPDRVWRLSSSSGAIQYMSKSTSRYAWPIRIPGAPDITVSSTSLNFGEVTVGNASEQLITITNDGIEDLKINTLSKPDQPFGITADNCSVKTISPAQSCSLTVEFKPTEIGNYSGEIKIPSNDPNEITVVIDLIGKGITAATAEEVAEEIEAEAEAKPKAGCSLAR